MARGRVTWPAVLTRGVHAHSMAAAGRVFSPESMRARRHVRDDVTCRRRWVRRRMRYRLECHGVIELEGFVSLRHRCTSAHWIEQTGQ